MTALSKGLGLVQWVRDQIKRLEESLFPTVRALRRVDRYRVELEIEQSGAKRIVIVRDTAHDLLKRLAENGQAEAYRGVKQKLVHSIPELSPWIGVVGKTAPLNGDNRATYMITEPLRPRIAPLAATK